ncbi:MAG: aspartate-semialdehyde dehydrogenase [Candidatus Thorarchaeota archaeon]
MRKLKVCVLGATGMVGQQFIRILDGHPTFELALLTASERSKGLQYREATDWVVSQEIPHEVSEMTVDSTIAKRLVENDIDLAFSALPSSIAEEVELNIARAGIPVFSNAGAHRMNDDVPILIPEINPGHLDLVRTQGYDGGFIVTNSNCSTSGLVFGLKPLMQFGIKEVMVTTYQAISGAGRRGVASLDILGNVIPFISSEESKLETEARVILGKLNRGKVDPASFEINASCARVPVKDGHLESVVVDLEEDIPVEEIIKVFDQFSGEPQSLNLPTTPNKPIIVHLEDDRPQPLRDLTTDAGDLGMAVSIGRIRKKKGRLNFFLLVHNTIRGAAGASVLNAEYALAKGYLKSRKEVSC